MNKNSIRFLTSALIFIFGVSIVVAGLCYQESQRIKVELPNANWEQIFFKTIDKTTKLSDLKELRKTRLKKDDIEVRVWRGFDLGNLEGVIFKRTSGQWLAFHLMTDHYIEPQKVEMVALNTPKSGWHLFWNNVVEKEILTLRDPSETNCEVGGIDATSYVVEINEYKTYRTYRLSKGKCEGVERMEEIGNIIGEEFDSGREECKTSEWFACTKFRKLYKQSVQ